MRVLSVPPKSVVFEKVTEPVPGEGTMTELILMLTKDDVTIAAPLNLPATMPEHASELYSKNITALLDLLIKDGKLAPDFGDEVVAESCVTLEKTREDT